MFGATFFALATPIGQLSRVGKTTEKHLQRMGIMTVRDLLFHAPFRYEDYRGLRAIRDLTEGEEVTIEATIELIANKRSARKRMVLTEAVVSDGTGRMRLVWFRQPYIGHVLQTGNHVFFSGTVARDFFGLTLKSPSFERVATGKAATHTARLLPMYSLTRGVTQKHLRSLVVQCLDAAEQIPEWIPPPLLQSLRLTPLPQAVRQLHIPADASALAAARRRLKFGELFLLQLKAEAARRVRSRMRAPALPFPKDEIRAFVLGLPYRLTNDQKIAAWEILRDLEKEMPMNRLLQGDVGCGKTTVAAMAAFTAAVRGYRTLFMAPTEILAQQHYETISELFQTTSITVGLLTRGQTRAPNAAIVVGTHALLERDDVQNAVGLVIVDEQHRFGVEHRQRIRGAAHLLSMTATPIPRSLALTMYGDLDVSLIRTLPSGRRPVLTRVVEPNARSRAYAFIRAEVKKGRQAFVVCPLIEGGEESRMLSQRDERKTVLREHKRLSEEIFPDLRVGFLHGKLKAGEKDKTMRAFAAGDIDILVATSVIEVGVNISNATVMMIEGAEQYGLAQLHQFRGRVGRSSYASYCFVFPHAPSPEAVERLSFFEKTADGFQLAEYDLERRGPGDVYGKEQSGLARLRFASISDTELIRLARRAARDLDIDRYPLIKKKLTQFEQSVHLE